MISRKTMTYSHKHNCKAIKAQQAKEQQKPKIVRKVVKTIEYVGKPETNPSASEDEGESESEEVSPPPPPQPKLTRATSRAKPPQASDPERGKRHRYGHIELFYFLKNISYNIWSNKRNHEENRQGLQQTVRITIISSQKRARRKRRNTQT